MALIQLTPYIEISGSAGGMALGRRPTGICAGVQQKQVKPIECETKQSEKHNSFQENSTKH